jgi:hypothetical protein
MNFDRLTQPPAAWLAAAEDLLDGTEVDQAVVVSLGQHVSDPVKRLGCGHVEEGLGNCRERHAAVRDPF